MALKKRGKQTFILQSKPTILSVGTVAGKKEWQGHLGEYFDIKMHDALYSQESWEKAERKMMCKAMECALNKANLTENDIDLFLAGDLLNQIVTSSFAAREFAFPFMGLYGACSAMTYSLGLSSMLIDGGFADRIICGASSHFCTAERQYRFPLEMGGVRPASAQWTATGAGAVVLGNKAGDICISHVTTGRVIDYGIDDVNYMGAAMAPAAANTFTSFFEDTNTLPKDFDVIITGDLGKYGSKLLYELMSKNGYDIESIHTDCGCELYKNDPHVLAGGSGCGCSAIYMSKLLNDIRQGKYKRVLMASTGALMSPTTSFQRDTIPSIANAIVLESVK
ncbi:MAG: stage V sporulation protein AD [Clostridiales bacterium]|nr:stage V sporulation protein AD [Clostridiales bacterium]